LFSSAPQPQANQANQPVNLLAKQSSMFGKKDGIWTLLCLTFVEDEVSDEENDEGEDDDEPQRSQSPERDEKDDKSYNDPNYDRISYVS
jgi:hypothetical protein